ncbi:amino acid ABC transporter permease [Burkholderia cepacia]|uniref:amino acid ABC transporter permease n=1 Tax=Burkholderia cepacia TaxID=292 RepID=UPI0007573E95|nr:amino acid ABC transporter permease [Burkholderia cepacia]KVR68987.1 amino acid ABC transporter permease [Burkholderia cepacia]
MLDFIRNNWQMLLLGQYPNGPLGGLALTLILSVLGLALSFPFSILIALGRTSPISFIRAPTSALVYVVRGVPLIMLIFWAYFFVPLVIGHSVSGFTTLLCTLVMYEAAYLGEVIRAGIEALPRGQVEASRALGLSYMQTVFKIVLPQALYNMLPSIVSQFVSTIKDTSLGYVISVQELTYAANQVNNSLLTQPFSVFAILALTYFAVCFILTQFAHRLERRVHHRRKGTLIKRSTADDLLLQGE